MQERIQIIHAKKINQEKWDACIKNCPQSIVYAYYIYLSFIADDWYGAIIGDYVAVMPIPVRRKWGLRYAYTPPFMQQLGFFGKVNTHQITGLINKVKQFVWYGSFSFNALNIELLEMIPTQTKTNFILSINQPYDAIYNSFSTTLKSHLKKAVNENLHYSIGTIEEAIATYTTLYGDRMPHVKAKDYSNFQKLCVVFKESNNVLVRKVVNAEGVLLAIALFLDVDSRLYNLMPSTTLEGRDKHAMHYLMSALIEEFATKRLIVDFEGSDIQGVKQFYNQFSPVNEPYYLWKRNMFSDLK